MRRTVELCDERLEAEFAAAEVLLIDLGGTPEEIEAAIGRGGYFYKMIRETETWLAGNDGTRH